MSNLFLYPQADLTYNSYYPVRTLASGMTYYPNGNPTITDYSGWNQINEGVSTFNDSGYIRCIFDWAAGVNYYGQLNGSEYGFNAGTPLYWLPSGQFTMNFRYRMDSGVYPSGYWNFIQQSGTLQINCRDQDGNVAATFASQKVAYSSGFVNLTFTSTNYANKPFHSLNTSLGMSLNSGQYFDISAVEYNIPGTPMARSGETLFIPGSVSLYKQQLNMDVTPTWTNVIDDNYRSGIFNSSYWKFNENLNYTPYGGSYVNGVWTSGNYINYVDTLGGKTCSYLSPLGHSGISLYQYRASAKSSAFSTGAGIVITSDDSLIASGILPNSGNYSFYVAITNRVDFAAVDIANYNYYYSGTYILFDNAGIYTATNTGYDDYFIAPNGTSYPISGNSYLQLINGSYYQQFTKWDGYIVTYDGRYTIYGFTPGKVQMALQTPSMSRTSTGFNYKLYNNNFQIQSTVGTNSIAIAPGPNNGSYFNGSGYIFYSNPSALGVQELGYLNDTINTYPSFTTKFANSAVTQTDILNHNNTLVYPSGGDYITYTGLYMPEEILTETISANATNNNYWSDLSNPTIVVNDNNPNIKTFYYQPNDKTLFYSGWIETSNLSGDYLINVYKNNTTSSNQVTQYNYIDGLGNSVSYVNVITTNVIGSKSAYLPINIYPGLNLYSGYLQGITSSHYTTIDNYSSYSGHGSLPAYFTNPPYYTSTDTNNWYASIYQPTQYNYSLFPDINWDGCQVTIFPSSLSGTTIGGQRQLTGASVNGQAKIHSSALFLEYWGTIPTGVSNALTLFVSGVGLMPNSMDLFVGGFIRSISGDCTLFVNGDLNKSTDLFIKGNGGTVSGGMGLVEWAAGSSSGYSQGNTTLFISNRNQFSGGATLFIDGPGSGFYNRGTTLFIKRDTLPSHSGLNLMVKTDENIVPKFSTFATTLFLDNYGTSSGYAPLYITAPSSGFINSSIGLKVFNNDVFKTIQSNASLMVQGPQTLTSFTSLVLQGIRSLTGRNTLFLGADASGNKATTLYMNSLVGGFPSKSAPLFLDAPTSLSTPKSGSMSLHTIGPYSTNSFLLDSKNGNTPLSGVGLFIYGTPYKTQTTLFIRNGYYDIDNGSMPLVIANKLNVSGQTSLYTIAGINQGVVDLVVLNNLDNYASGIMPLSIFSSAHSGLFSYAPMFMESNGLGVSVPLFLSTQRTANVMNTTTLYTKAGNSARANVPLTLQSVYQTYSGVQLNVVGAGDLVGGSVARGNITLFINRPYDNIGNGIGLVVNGPSGVYNSVNLSISGGTSVHNNIALSMPSSVGLINNNTSLFTHGF